MYDLHLETPEARPTYEAFKIQPQHQYLVLLGDIGNVSDHRLFVFLGEQPQHFETVYLLGNHEPYGMTVPTAQARVHAFEEDVERLCSTPDTAIGRFVLLNRTRYDLKDSVVVLACTFFSRLVPEQRESAARFISDLSSIEDWTVDSHCAAHQANLQWLNSQVADIMQHEPHRSIIIFTHHSPTMLKAAMTPDI